MARLNEILVGRVNRGLQRVFGIKGPPPVATLAPEVMPVHIVSGGVETRYLESWNRYGFTRIYGPTAANQNTARILNPSGSNAIIVIEKLTISTTAPTNVAVSISSSLPNLSARENSFSIDSRNTAQSAAVWSHIDSAGATGNAIYAVELFAATGGTVDVILTENQEINLLAGDSLTFIQSAVNTLYVLSVIWRERFLEDSEKI